MRIEVEEVEQQHPERQRAVPGEEREEEELLHRQAAADQPRRDEGDRGEARVAQPAVDGRVHERVLDAAFVELEGEVEEADRRLHLEGHHPQRDGEHAERGRHGEPQRSDDEEAAGRGVRAIGDQRAAPLRRLVVRAELLRVHPGIHRHGRVNPFCGDRSGAR
jgi:hypothetical protein